MRCLIQNTTFDISSPLSATQGDGEMSSSDAQRFKIRADSLLASYYPRYYGYTKTNLRNLIDGIQGKLYIHSDNRTSVATSRNHTDVIEISHLRKSGGYCFYPRPENLRSIDEKIIDGELSVGNACNSDSINTEEKLTSYLSFKHNCPI